MDKKKTLRNISCVISNTLLLMYLKKYTEQFY